jgi:signal transduction histidine kinase
VRRWPRWLAEPPRHWVWLLWPAAAVVGITAEWRLYGWADPGDWVPDLLTGWTMIGCGLAGWSRRPQSRSGALLVAAGFAWFAPNFAATGAAALAWLSAHALYLYRGPLVQLVLTFPRGRPVRRLDRAAVAAGYAAAVITPVWADETATIVVACLLVAVAVRGYACAAGRERRMRLAALEATAVLAAVLVAVTLARLAAPAQAAQAANAATLHAYQAALCGLSLGLLVGLLRGSWERAEVADLVVELGATRSGTLRDELARALGDPSLQVGYWVPQPAGFVDSEGRPIRVPDPGSGRSMTMVERDGQPLAVLVHDPAVLGDPGLVEAVSSAARLAAANVRLQAEVRGRLAEIGASRRRILEAGDEERGRLERRLREGALRRLDEVAETLRRARRPAAGGAGERLARAESQLARTQEELRRLAHGIHPRELSERGLAAALASLARDVPLPVKLAVSAAGESPAAAACAYFVCAEALANLAKYAAASKVAVSVRSDPGGTTVEIEDDGVGGADPGRGTGLRGLADRVETLGGTLTVDSPPGRGTRLVAVIPHGAGAA